MINVLALGLLVSTLAAAGIWSPSPNQVPDDYQNNVVLKEGHRVIVVEHEREGLQKPITDSSAGKAPAPPMNNLEIPHGLVEEAKQKFKEAAAELPNLGQGVSGPLGGSKEKICDADGRCKEKISIIYSKEKEIVSDGVSRAEGVGKDAVESVVQGSEAVVEKAEEGMRNVAHGGEAVVEKTKEAAENLAHGGEAVVEKAKEAAGNVVHGGEKAVDKAKEAVEDVVHGGEAVVDKAKEAVGSAIHGGETVVETVAEKAKHGGEKVAEKTKSFKEEHVREEMHEMAEEAQEMAEEAVAKTKDGVEKTKVTLGHARERERRRVMDVYKAVISAFTPEASRILMCVVHLLSFSITYGVCVWITFVSSYLLATVMPRQQFGVVQSKIYPVYFRVVACGIGLCLLSFLFSRGHGRRGYGLAETLQCYNLLGSLGLVLVNMLYLEPRATKVMYERLKLEKEEAKGREIADMVSEPVVTTTTTRKMAGSAGDGGVNATTFPATATSTAGNTAQQGKVKLRAVKLSKRLKKLNTNSSFVNIMALMCLTWHLVYLAEILHAAG